MQEAGHRTTAAYCEFIVSIQLLTLFLTWVKLCISWTLTELDETLNGLSRAQSLVQSPSTSGNV